MALKLKCPPPVGHNFELRKKLGKGWPVYIDEDIRMTAVVGSIVTPPLVAISKQISGLGTNVTIIMGPDGIRNEE
jgi:hypothetical protein